MGRGGTFRRKKTYSFKDGGKKRYVCKVGRGINNNKFCDDGISKNKKFRQNTSKTFLRVKTMKLFPGHPPRSPYFIIYPAATTNSYCMAVKYSQKVKRGNINSFCFCLFFFWGGGKGGCVGVLTEQEIHLSIQNAENFLKGSLEFDNFLGEDGCPTRKCPFDLVCLTGHCRLLLLINFY